MTGLTTKEAAERLKTYGFNSIEGKKKKSLLVRLFEQFNDFLTLLLIGAAALSFFIGEPVDGGLIIGIVVLNAFFGLFQEAKAEESIAALKKITVTKVRVVRDGKEQEIESQYLVPGDVCFVEEGVKIPADGKIVEGMNLEVNESVLTGESFPVVKKEGEEVFSGTIISKGRGFMEIMTTGMETKFGKIAANLSIIEEGETPLQKKLSDITRLIGIAGIIAAVAVFIISIIQGSSYFPAFLLSISLAVAVVPEGLPAVMTITLSIGVSEMSKKKSIIRKLSAIEALGSVTLIATDKTGTLTTNKMKVTELFVDNQIYTMEHLPHMENHPFMLMLRNGILCSTASLVYVHDHGNWDVLGDPTEGALLYLAQHIGLELDTIKKEWSIVDEQPFDSVTKRMSVLVQHTNDLPAGRQGQRLMTKMQFTKGAPESILEICDSLQVGNEIKKMTFEERKKIEEQVAAWAKKGLRVLGFSYKQLKSVEIGLNQSGLTESIFLGLVAIHDAPRPEVKDAVVRAKTAGINIVMITGDNEKTAEAVGVTAGIIGEGEDIMTGKQLEEYSDEQLLVLLPKTRIFARTTPFHKHRIVKLYQQLGEVVAVTGDGVNDAIALKQADVGVAMGLVGTDVARETADMVITDDNFASIVNAVEEGRNIIKNLKNAVQYLLSCNISEALSLVGGLLLGFNHLFFPLQLLYINLITDGIPALALAFSPRNPRLMNEHPEKDLKLLKPREQKYILYVGVISTILILLSYYNFSKVQEGLAQSAVFSVLILTQSFIFLDLWLSHQSLHKNIKHLFSPLFITSFLFPFLFQFIILKSTVLSGIFKVSVVSFQQYVLFAAISSLIFVGIKGVKQMVKI